MRVRALNDNDGCDVAQSSPPPHIALRRTGRVCVTHLQHEPNADRQSCKVRWSHQSLGVGDGANEMESCGWGLKTLLKGRHRGKDDRWYISGDTGDLNGQYLPLLRYNMWPFQE